MNLRRTLGRPRALVLALVAAACGRGQDGAPPPAGPTTVAAAEGSTSEPATAGPVGYFAVVAPVATIDVRAESSGLLSEVHVDAGDRVRAGGPIARIDDRGLRASLRKAQAARRRAAADRRRTDSELEHTEGLAAQADALADILAADELASARHRTRLAAADDAAARGALAEHDAEIARLHDLDAALDVRSPVAGTVELRHHVAGEWVDAGEPIVRVVARDAVVRFAIPTDDAPDIRPGDTLAFEAQGRRVPIDVSWISPTVDAAGMLLVEAVPGTTVPWRYGTPGRVLRM